MRTRHWPIDPSPAPRPSSWPSCLPSWPAPPPSWRVVRLWGSSLTTWALLAQQASPMLFISYLSITILKIVVLLTFVDTRKVICVTKLKNFTIPVWPRWAMWSRAAMQTYLCWSPQSQFTDKLFNKWFTFWNYINSLTHPPPLSPAAAMRCELRPYELALETKWVNTEEKSMACWGHLNSGASLGWK